MSGVSNTLLKRQLSANQEGNNMSNLIGQTTRAKPINIYTDHAYTLIYKENDTIQIDRNISTTVFINRFLKLDYYIDLNKYEPEEIYIYLLENYLLTHKNIISDYIKKLKYDFFVQTAYWRGISNYIRHKADGLCPICLSKDRSLITHHKTYTNHGKELTNFQDLEAMCSICHKHEHGKTLEHTV